MAEANDAAVDRHKQLMAMESGNSAMAIIPGSLGEVVTLAGAIAASGLAPQGMNTADKVTVAILMGLELGLPPMQAIQSIAVVNGRPSLWGNIGLALIQRSGLLEEFDEGFTGVEALEAKDFPDDFKAWVKMKRKGLPARTVDYSVMDAKRARLWNGMDLDSDKAAKSPWFRHPKAMLRWRARWTLFNALFTDVLKGMQGVEELQDEVIDVTPAPVAPTKPRDDISSKLAGGGKVEVVYTSGKDKPAKPAEPDPSTFSGGPREDATDVEVVEHTGETAEAAQQAPAAGETTPQPPSIEVDLTGITDLFEQGAVSELATALVKVDSAARMSVLEDEFNATIDMGGETFQTRMRGMIAARAKELGIERGSGE